MQPPSTPTRGSRGGSSRGSGMTMASRYNVGGINNSSNSNSHGNHGSLSQLQKTPSSRRSRHRNAGHSYSNDKGEESHNGNEDEEDEADDDDDDDDDDEMAQNLLVTPQTVTKFKPTSSVLRNIHGTRTPEQPIYSPNLSSRNQAVYLDNNRNDNSTGNKNVSSLMHKFNRGINKKRHHIGTATPGHEEDARDSLLSKLFMRSPEYTPQKEERIGVQNASENIFQGEQQQQQQTREEDSVFGHGIKRKLEFNSATDISANNILQHKLHKESLDIFGSDNESADEGKEESSRGGVLNFKNELKLGLPPPLMMKSKKPAEKVAEPSTPTKNVISFEQAEEWHNMSPLHAQDKYKKKIKNLGFVGYLQDEEEEEVFITKKVLKNPFLSDDNENNRKNVQNTSENNNSTDSEGETQKLKNMLYNKE